MFESGIYHQSQENRYTGVPWDKLRGPQKKINNNQSNEIIPLNIPRGLDMQRVYLCPFTEG